MSKSRKGRVIDLTATVLRLKFTLSGVRTFSLGNVWCMKNVSTTFSDIKREKKSNTYLKI